MILFVLLAVGLISVSFPSGRALHPNATALLLGDEAESLDCSEAPPPDSALDAPAGTRASQWGLRGSFVCRRADFSRAERNPLADAVLRAEIPKAKRAAAGLRRLRDERPLAAPLAVGASGPVDPELLGLVAAIYRTEFASTLGPGSVSRGVASEPAMARIAIEVRRSDSPETISRAVLIERGPNGEERWQEL